MLAPLLAFLLAAPGAVVKHGPTAMHTVQVKKDIPKPKPEPAGKLEAKKDATRAPSVEPKKTEPKKDEPKSEPKNERTEKKDAKKGPCLRFPIAITHGTEEDFFSLTSCDGSAALGAVERLSILARPDVAEKPKQPIADLVKVQGADLAPNVKRVDERLPRVIQNVLDHFDKFGVARKVHLISGYRPASKGSFHATAQALDLRIDGVSNEQIIAFCKSLADVGCGYYPNSTFVHIDVRPVGTGHVAWIDSSGPGELPNYVSKWPPDPFDDDPRRSPLPSLPRMIETKTPSVQTLGSADL